MKRYEIHLHTNYSKCSNSDPKKVLETAKERNLNGIAITDHNTVKGAVEIKKLNNKLCAVPLVPISVSRSSNPSRSA